MQTVKIKKKMVCKNIADLTVTFRLSNINTDRLKFASESIVQSIDKLQSTLQPDIEAEF